MKNDLLLWSIARGKDPFCKANSVTCDPYPMGRIEEDVKDCKAGT